MENFKRFLVVESLVFNGNSLSENDLVRNELKQYKNHKLYFAQTKQELLQFMKCHGINNANFSKDIYRTIDIYKTFTEDFIYNIFGEKNVILGENIQRSLIPEYTPLCITDFQEGSFGVPKGNFFQKFIFEMDENKKWYIALSDFVFWVKTSSLPESYFDSEKYDLNHFRVNFKGKNQLFFKFNKMFLESNILSNQGEFCYSCLDNTPYLVKN